MTTGGTDGWMTTRAGKRGLWTAAVLAAGLGALALVAPPLTPGTIESAPVTVITTTPPAPVVPLTPEELSAQVVPTIVTITAPAGFTTTAGTGIVLSPDGVVLTNHHVISGASDVTAVSMSNGLIYDAEILGYDSVSDLAVLRLAGATDLPVAVVGKSAEATRGDAVTAIGNAEGGGVPVPAPGVITNLGVTVNTRNVSDGSRNQLKGLIEVDADIRPGDSGGPLVNAVGELIGVSSAGNAVTDRTETSPAPQSYAIPIDTALPIVEQVLGGRSSETVRVGPTPVLGVAVKDHAEIPAGAEVVAVSFDSPAERVGLTKGAVITEFGGSRIASSADLNAAMSSRRPGDTVAVTWVDATGQPGTGSLVLDEGPPR
ncbi:serine protease, S1-C subfamily, contains C-terminal PDZ domain [Rhodococcus erythropolis]|nr:serine protease, S1-C subfamily, contains C-terminal PDZ domain [Rhodococcus erythropolis]